MPCWVDLGLPDLAGGKRFYSGLFGWDFTPPGAEYGDYTDATSGGKAVAGLHPQPPGRQDGGPAWVLYFATDDVRATANKVREHGGSVLQGPMELPGFGTVLTARDPGGVTFGAWQAARHPGFGKRGEPGAFAWAEVVTRDASAADAFYPAVFPFRAQRLGDPADYDYVAWNIGSETVAGRFAMPASTSPEIAPHVQVYFSVADCDEAVAAVSRLGGRLIDGPMDSPYGRFAAVADPQGASFAVIDTDRRMGEPPQPQQP